MSAPDEPREDRPSLPEDWESQAEEYAVEEPLPEELATTSVAPESAPAEPRRSAPISPAAAPLRPATSDASEQPRVSFGPAWPYMALLVALVFAAFAPALSAEFVNWDDP